MEKVKTILLVEDEKEQAEILADYLEDFKFKVLLAHSGDQALKLIDDYSGSISLAALDIMLPGMDGKELCCFIRAHEFLNNIPIIFITAKDREIDEIDGLKAGADAYISKPTSLSLIKTRIDVLLRNSNPESTNVVHHRDLVIDLNTSELYIGGEEVVFTPSEFEIIKLLIRNHRKVYSRQQILTNIFSESHFVFDRTVDTHVKNIRQKLQDYSKIIKTHYGSGYSLELV